MRYGILAAVLLWIMPAQAVEFGLRTGAMWLTPSGQMALAAGGVPGTQLDVKQQMNLKRDVLPYGELSAEWGRHAFHLTWWKSAFQGTSQDPLLRFNFNGQAFFNPPYRFRLEMDMLDGGFSYFPLVLERPSWRLRLGAELAARSIRTRARVDEANFSQAVSNLAIIPTFGLRADASLKSWLTLSGRYSVFRMSGNSLRDIEAMLDINPLLWYSDIYTVNLFAGYRQIKIKLNTNSSGQLQADTTWKGPLAGLRLVY